MAEKENGISVGKVAGIAAWAAITQKLALPSLLRATELFVFNREAVVNSDIILSLLALSTCPLSKVQSVIRFKDPKETLIGAVVAAVLGLHNVVVRHAKLNRLKEQSMLLPGEEAVWRRKNLPGNELMVVSYDEASTCYHNFFTFARQRFADNPCLGTRTGDGFSWESYELTARRASDFGAGLVYLGLKPGDRFGIYSVNNAEWVLAELGGYCYGLVNVSLYATLGQEAVTHVVNHSEMVAVVCSVEVSGGERWCEVVCCVETLSSLFKALPSAPAVKNVIYMQGGGQAPSDADRQAAEAAGVKLIPFSQVEEWGAQNPQEHIPPKPEDLAVLMYTSGTTGDPKGVMLMHRNIIANTTSCPAVLGTSGVTLGSGDRYLSYLPLAHIFERAALASMYMQHAVPRVFNRAHDKVLQQVDATPPPLNHFLSHPSPFFPPFQGVAVGFYSGKVESLLKDMGALKPTVLFGVPRVFNKVHDKVLQQVDATPPPLNHFRSHSSPFSPPFQGVAVGFYSGKVESLLEDMGALKPTVLFGVPRVFNKVHDKVLQQVDAGSALKRFLFNSAIGESAKVLKAGGAFKSLPLWDTLIFKKVQAPPHAYVLLYNRCLHLGFPETRSLSVLSLFPTSLPATSSPLDNPCLWTTSLPLPPTSLPATSSPLDNPCLWTTSLPLPPTSLPATSSPLDNPCPPPSLQFLAIAFGCPALQGYGLSETSAAGTITALEDPNTGHVGPPQPSVDMKLAPVPEMEYLPSDKPKPRGEICFRGASVMVGYYKQQEMTAEVIDSDGWFHTGDIGQVNEDGTLTIIDRKKNIFKLAQGEYVAAEKLEVLYAGAAVVAQIFVYGDSFKSSLVAVVVPEKDVLSDWATSSGALSADEAATASLADLGMAFELNTTLPTPFHPCAPPSPPCHSCALPGAREYVLDELKCEIIPSSPSHPCTPLLSLSTAAPCQEQRSTFWITREYVLDELVKRAKATSMKGFEVVRGVALEAEAFTTENDLMTPSFKLKRPKLKAKYQAAIDELYTTLT
ncbi:unnamed protein product [Closterium sp. NIES-53]